jgi:hypothetical protein
MNSAKRLVAKKSETNTAKVNVFIKDKFLLLLIFYKAKNIFWSLLACEDGKDGGPSWT